jgi:hypothetical protein
MLLKELIHCVAHDAPEAPEAKAVVIGAGAHRPIIDALSQLYAHQHTDAVLCIDCPEQAVAGCIDDCLKNDRIAIVVGDAPFTYAGASAFSAAVVAPSARLPEQEPYRTLLAHPQLDLFSAIAFQTYLTSPDDMEWLRLHFCETLRLGLFREKPALAEPLLREAHHVFFDLSALRASDAPETRRPTPNGLYAEELCQLAAFAGRAPALQTFRLSGFAAPLAPSSLTAQAAAQVLWHLLEGIAVGRRLKVSNEPPSHIKKMIVDMGDSGHTLEFLNDTLTGHWWLQIPLTDGASRSVACLYDDYLCACRHEIPERWLRYFQKFNKG